MSDKRAGLFEDELDVSGFAPRPQARAEQVKAVAEEAGFRSRGPVPAQGSTPTLPSTPAQAKPPPLPPAEERREQRRYRTGRNQ